MEKQKVIFFTGVWVDWGKDGETMKTKVVDYNDIVSVHNGEEYYHGQIIYSDYKSSNGVDLLRLNIDMALCILPDEQENFLKEISDLVNKYSK